MNWGISVTSLHREARADANNRIAARVSDHARPATAFFVPVLLLLPFIAKPFHIDDPLFVWMAQHIIESPLDFFGFEVNWMERRESISLANNNPPAWSYVLAAFGLAFGFSEPALHAAMLLTAGLTGLGIYRLAERLTPQPMLATLLAVVSPGFFVSATTLMCDVPMVCAYVWAVYCWLRGMENDRDQHAWLFAATSCVALSMLFKFYGLTALLLLACYGIARRGRPGPWCLHLFVPIAALIVYELWTWNLYGRGHLSSASEYSMGSNQIATLSAAWNRLLTTFTFIGACFMPVLIAGILFLRRNAAIVFAAMSFALAVILFSADRIAYYEPQSIGYTVQAWIAVSLGAATLILTALAIAKRRDPETVLLFFWVIGAVVFTAFFNHLINARTILPMLPALAIIVSQNCAAKTRWPFAIIPFAAALSISLAAADTQFANAHKQAAKQFAQAGVPDAQRTFLGHWGFHYYLEQSGWTSLDLSTIRPDGKIGDLLAVPGANERQRSTGWTKLDEIEFTSPPLHLIGTKHGAGFYAHQWGPMPYILAPTEAWRFTLYRISHDD